MKGQIFTLDMLLALAAVTAVLGYTTMQFENVYSQSHNLEYQKMQTLADDIAQLAVKNLLAKANSPNDLDSTKLAAAQTTLDAIMPSVYSYEIAFVSNSIHSGACAGKSNIAISNRVITGGTLTAKVCS